MTKVVVPSTRLAVGVVVFSSIVLIGADVTETYRPTPCFVCPSNTSSILLIVLVEMWRGEGPSQPLPDPTISLAAIAFSPSTLMIGAPSTWFGRATRSVTPLSTSRSSPTPLDVGTMSTQLWGIPHQPAVLLSASRVGTVSTQLWGIPHRPAVLLSPSLLGTMSAQPWGYLHRPAVLLPTTM
jgi:hypothetical protein